MSESSHFEKHETTPQSNVDFESILERGEIESLETMEGYFPVQVVKIKDDGKALFKVNSENAIADKKYFLRTELELLAAKVDEILGFGLVPVAASRAIDSRKGVMQRYIEDATVAVSIKGNDWSKLVDDAEIQKAAIFDYLMDTRDRHTGNFLVDTKTRKIWLIDHDYIMFFETIIPYRVILETAVRKNLVELPEEIRVAIKNLLARLDSIGVDADPKVQEILDRIKIKAEELLIRGTLT